MIARLLSQALPWLIVAVLMLNMAQKRHGEAGHTRRLASLYLALALAALFATAWTVVNSEHVLHIRLNDAALLAPAALIGFVLWTFRRRVFPYRLRCAGCGKRLPIRQIALSDEANCEACRRPAAQAPIRPVSRSSDGQAGE
jgi:hypothetical protein